MYLYMEVMHSRETIVSGLDKPELKQCSRCRSKILLSFFDKNRQGEYKKLCKNCSKKKPEGDWIDSLTDFGREHIDNINQDKVNKCRKLYIQSFVGRGFKYIGKLNEDDANYPANAGPQLSGDEIVIEFHLFKHAKKSSNDVQQMAVKTC
jgi:hypothetical protein